MSKLRNAARHTALNAAASFVQAARAAPEKVALHFPAKVGFSQLSYRELLDLSGRYALGFHKAGVMPGERVVLLCPPDATFFALTLALFRAGLVPVFIDPKGGAAHIKRCLAEAAPSVFIGTRRARLTSIALGWLRGKKLLRIVTDADWPGLRLGALQAASEEFDAAEFDTVPTRASDLAAVFFTSGSTGAAKAVLHTHANLNAQLETLAELYPTEPDTVSLPTLPAFAFFDFALGLTSVLPATDTLSPARADPAKLVEAIETFGVTQMFASPVLADRLGYYAEQQGTQLPSLRRVVTAGAAANPKVLRRLTRILAETTEIAIPYGATECLPLSSISAASLLAETAAKTEAGWGICVGKVAPNTRVQIMTISDKPITKWQSKLRQKRGEVGEVIVRGPQVSESYLLAAANALHKVDDAGATLHRTGDLGYFDRQGRLWLVGRKSQRVHTEQGLLFPLACEPIFQRHPSVSRAALVGVEDKNGVVQAVLCAELEPAVNKHEHDMIRRDLLELAQTTPATKQLRIFLFHPGLPTDARHNSKILREQVARWAQKQVKRR